MDYFKEIKKVLNDQSYNYSDRHLRDAIDDHFESKRWIAKTIGLDESNEWRIYIDLPSTEETKPLARDIVYQLCKTGDYQPHDMNFLIHRKCKIRITKVINEMYEGIDEQLMCAIREQIRDAYPNSDPYRKEVFLCWYGDYIKNGRRGMITINPLDYFTLSGQMCAYSSCIRVGGEYDNTIMHYLASDCVMPSFVLDDKGKKIGRSLIYLNEWRVMQGRVYGSMFSPDLLLIRDYIHNKIGGRWIKINEHIDSNRLHNRTTGYVDNGYGIVTERKHDEGFDPTPLLIATGMCLECGDGIHDSSCGLVCEYCGGYTCEWCNERYDGDEYCVGDDRVCRYCYENHAFQCDSCESMYHNEDRYEVEGDNVCRWCFEEHCGRCYECEEGFYSDNMKEHDGEYYCKQCFQEKFDICENCGGSYDKNEMREMDNEIYCEDCFHEKYESCEICGESFERDKMKQYEDCYYCDDCYDKLEREDDNEIAENREVVNQ